MLSESLLEYCQPWPNKYDLLSRDSGKTAPCALIRSHLLGPFIICWAFAHYRWVFAIAPCTYIPEGAIQKGAVTLIKSPASQPMTCPLTFVSSWSPSSRYLKPPFFFERAGTYPVADSQNKSHTLGYFSFTSKAHRKQGRVHLSWTSFGCPILLPVS